MPRNFAMAVVLRYSVCIFPKFYLGTSGEIAALHAPVAEGPGAAMVVNTTALPCSEPTPKLGMRCKIIGVCIILRSFRKSYFIVTCVDDSK